MNTEPSIDTISPQERLRLAIIEYQEAFWSADGPGTGVNISLRAWMDIVNVHRMIHFNNNCNGPTRPNIAMAKDSPPPCELATAEQDSKDRVINGMEALIEGGWAITATIERSLP